jgi:hypothetical protein
MNKKQQSKEMKKRIDKAQRLRNLIGVDLCACGPLNCLRCHGICREEHTDENGQVVCGEKYHVDPNIFNLKKRSRRPHKEKTEKQKQSRKQNRRREEE